MPPVVTRTCYDGDEFGEIFHFTRNTNELKEMFKEQNEIEPNLFSKRPKLTKEMLEDLTQEEVDRLNVQRTSATTMEPCDLLCINKVLSIAILSKNMQQESFMEKLNFLWKIDLFTGINKNHLLPLISNIIVRTYRRGEFIQQEGAEPEGMMIIKEGNAAVCSSKLSLRRLPDGQTDGTPQPWEQTQQSSLASKSKMSVHMKNVIAHTSSRRIYQNKQLYLDEYKHIVPKNVIIYNDLLIFKILVPGNCFGGRSLLAQNNLKNVQRQLQRDLNIRGSKSISDALSKQFAGIERQRRELRETFGLSDEELRV
jgi:hypothetical protein